jgi:CubicO group peptidase (beta-lactamase class C family)
MPSLARIAAAGCIAFGLLAPPAAAPAPRRDGGSTPDPAVIDSFLQAQVRADRIPGVAFALVQDDRILFAKGYGEAAPGVPMTPQTQMYIGSVTKSFTALAALQLAERSTLELDAPVRRYLPWFRVADANAAEKITLRNLLNHTSGLSDAGYPHASADPATLEEQARWLADARPTAPVGERFQYFNPNYRVLGLVIERVSGLSYGEYLRRNILEPLGMADTVADPAEAPRLAQGYGRFFGFPLPRSQRFVPGALPSGYLISTAADMARFLIAQLGNRRADGEPLLGAEALAAMRTPPAGVAGGYGMGWMVLDDGTVLAHGGALDDFQSFVYLDLREKTGFVLLFNQYGLENMLVENNAVRDGVLQWLKGEIPAPVSFGWLGPLLLILAGLDLANHMRLFRRRFSRRRGEPGTQRTRRRILAAGGLLIPIGVLVGMPLAAALFAGGAPGWTEPLRLAPDLTIWLLAGMSLTLIRSLVYIPILWRRPDHPAVEKLTRKNT